MISFSCVNFNKADDNMAAGVKIFAAAKEKKIAAANHPVRNFKAMNADNAGSSLTNRFVSWIAGLVGVHRDPQSNDQKGPANPMTDQHVDDLVAATASAALLDAATAVDASKTPATPTANLTRTPMDSRTLWKRLKVDPSEAVPPLGTVPVPTPGAPPPVTTTAAATAAVPTPHTLAELVKLQRLARRASRHIRDRPTPQEIADDLDKYFPDLARLAPPPPPTPTHGQIPAGHAHAAWGAVRERVATAAHASHADAWASMLREVVKQSVARRRSSGEGVRAYVASRRESAASDGSGGGAELEGPPLGLGKPRRSIAEIMISHRILDETRLKEVVDEGAEEVSPVDEKTAGVKVTLTAPTPTAATVVTAASTATPAAPEEEAQKQMLSPAAARHAHIQNWVKGERIGSGQFGTVYHALNWESGENLAVKLVPILDMEEDSPTADVSSVKATKGKQEALDQLRWEMTALASFAHENIVRYVGYDIKDRHLSVFLEYVSGGTVSSVLGKVGAMDEGAASVFTSQILCGLVYLHGVGVVHRDIKGLNVLVDSDGVIKIADFGTSRRGDVGADRTEGRQPVGSPPWMSPEAARCEADSPSVDVWSLGCTVLEMLSGQEPWPALRKQGRSGAYAIIQRVGTGEHPPLPVDPQTGLCTLSTAAQDFLAQCFIPDRSSRPTARTLFRHPFCLGASEDFDFRAWAAEAEARARAAAGSEESLGSSSGGYDEYDDEDEGSSFAGSVAVSEDSVRVVSPLNGSDWSLKGGNGPSAINLTEQSDEALVQAYDAGFRNAAEQVEPIEMKVHGEIPAWFTGHLYRCAPSTFSVPLTKEGKYRTGKDTYEVSHWFDGLTQIHKFSVMPDGKVTYMSRATAKGLERYISNNGGAGITFGQKDPCKRFFSRMFTFISMLTGHAEKFSGPDETNIGVTLSTNFPLEAGLGQNEDMTLGPRNIVVKSDMANLQEIDPVTLEPLHQKINLKFSGPGSAAHGHFDASTGEYFNFVADYGKDITFRVIKISQSNPSGDLLLTLPRVPLSYIHSFALTGKYVIFPFWPYSTNLFSFLWSQNYAEPLTFDANKPLLWCVVSRATGEHVATYESPAAFGFHVVNAWDVEGTDDVIVEVPVADTGNFVKDLYLDSLRRGELESLPMLTRYTLRNVSAARTTSPGCVDPNVFTMTNAARAALNIPQAESRQLSDVHVELPRTHPSWHRKQHTVCYGISYTGTVPDLAATVHAEEAEHASRGSIRPRIFDCLVRIDTGECGDGVSAAKHKVWYEKGQFPGEPVFVPRPGGTEEDDGVLVSVVLRGQTEGREAESYLLFLDPRTMTEVARAEMGRARVVPFGFHGNFHSIAEGTAVREG
ncbi:hypothetical protein HK101_010874 [Irineochytrium annulatum]|nr:hypothetical protein HK101_010874 [Irineochytrium annulatum]